MTRDRARASADRRWRQRQAEPPAFTLPPVLQTAHETSLTKLHEAEWFFIFRTWAVQRETRCVSKLGPRWMIAEVFGKGWPLYPTKGEALGRVDQLVSAEAAHRARLAFEKAAAICTDPHLCQHCGETWPFDPARLVICPDCGALAGAPCKRPSGHPLMGKTYHATREPAAMAAGLLQRCKAAPALQEIDDKQPALF